MRIGQQMISWMKDMWDFPRSLTGHGTRATLSYLKALNNELTLHTFKTGQKVFDWEIPDEWNIHSARLTHESGQVIADMCDNNLHLVGYSVPCDMQLSKEELLSHIYTQPDQPDVIPYVTSYYKDRWGFCLTDKQKQELPEGNYHASIVADKGPGELHVGEIHIPGMNKEEIFFSTYICHPSMANNELSGPVLASSLSRYIKRTYPNPTYSYRFVFVPETIGSIAYLSRFLELIKKNTICGFNLSCVGDERAYSHLESRKGDSLADRALTSALIGLPNVVRLSYLERGSDERQYCAPGIDLPLCGFSRTKYGMYPEYHTSADDFSVVSEAGLKGAFDVMKTIIDTFEIGLFPRTTVLGEPNLGKRGLYPTISQKGEYADIRTRMNVLAYVDGNHSIFDIANRIQENLRIVIQEVNILKQHGLIEILD